MKTAVTLTIRTLSSGRKLCSMAMEDLTHAHSIAKTLVESPNYARCHVVATDWQQNVLFDLFPPEACAPPPVQMPQQQFYPPPQALHAHYPSPEPAARAYVDGREVECQIIQFPSLPAARR